MGTTDSNQNNDALCEKKLSIVHTLQASNTTMFQPLEGNHEEQHMQFVTTEWQTRVDVLAQESKYIG